MDGRMDGGRTDRWTDGQMDGWMDGWIDGWMDTGYLEPTMKPVMFCRKTSGIFLCTYTHTYAHMHAHTHACIHQHNMQHTARARTHTCMQALVDTNTGPGSRAVRIVLLSPFRPDEHIRIYDSLHTHSRCLLTRMPTCRHQIKPRTQQTNGGTHTHAHFAEKGRRWGAGWAGWVGGQVGRG